MLRHAPKNGHFFAKDGALSWSGLRVVDPDMFTDNWTEMDFQIENLLDRSDVPRTSLPLSQPPSPTGSG